MLRPLNLFSGRPGVSNLSWIIPSTGYFVCFPHLTYLNQLISSLVEMARPDVGVSVKGDIQNMQCWGFQDRFENLCGRPILNGLTLFVTFEVSWSRWLIS